MDIRLKIGSFLRYILGTRAVGLYLLLFATVIGVATFIENDFGTSAAQKVIYKSWWFELLLALFCLSLIYNIIVFRMIQQKKWALLTFHVSMIIIIIGAGVTRFYGYEGMMHIREKSSSNEFLSSDTYLNFEVITTNNRYRFDEPVLFASLGKNEFDEIYQIENKLIEIKLLDFIANPIQKMESSPEGKPTFKVVIAGINGREEYYISKGEKRTIGKHTFNFSDQIDPNAINLSNHDGDIHIMTPFPLIQTVMATQKTDTIHADSMWHPLILRSLYANEIGGFVFSEYRENALVKMVSEERKMKNESKAALEIEVNYNGNKQIQYIYGQKGLPGRPGIFRYEDLSLAIAYGAKPLQLPFSIYLKDFQLDRYPGTSSAASYASEVQLKDPRNNNKIDYRIYMNNILTYDGYRFFQSSYDQDELGTYLSVNHDEWGTRISYFGYALLTIGMVLIFFSNRSRFRQVATKVQSRALVIFLLLSTQVFGQKNIQAEPAVISASHASLFSTVVVQDYKGRMKPMHTLSRELLRKMCRKVSINGQNADQVVLSMFADKSAWLNVPMIKIPKEGSLKSMLGVTSGLVSYKDFFNSDGSYKLTEAVRSANAKNQADRTNFEKELLKVDERVNIANMIYNGFIFKVIPIPDDENNEWISTHNTPNHASVVADKFFPQYRSALLQAVKDGDYRLADQIITELKNYQKTYGSKILLSERKIKAEIWLNNLNVFNRLSLLYTVLGVTFLIMLFIQVFKPEWNLQKWTKGMLIVVIGGFLFHTFGLGLRWYVSGRAPWSNGYESLIYIAWTSTLAGLLFTRKTLGGLAATMILAATILFVAMLSQLDPEITPLVPVLRSYWLSIHVSLIAGSYGFLMLGAIIGIINLILMIMSSQANKNRVNRIISELTYISEMTLTGGLIMLSIGTYLGGVWANESWGRYWGWDAKETWALVTILVYAFILHMRIIPRLYSVYSYNLATLFGFGSVVMTYFGVNYYLSGLHSYAAGDPVPIPTWVYITVISVSIISVLAYVRRKSLLNTEGIVRGGF